MTEAIEYNYSHGLFSKIIYYEDDEEFTEVYKSTYSKKKADVIRSKHRTTVTGNVLLYYTLINRLLNIEERVES